MSESLSKASGLVGFVISLIYRLTVRLTLEFLKIGTLLVILFGTTGVIGLALVSLVWWAYTAYQGSVLAATVAVVLGVVLVLVTMVLVEFVVKDLLGLTDLPLVDLIKIILSALWKSNKRAGLEDQQRQKENQSSDSYRPIDQQVKKKS